MKILREKIFGITKQVNKAAKKAWETDLGNRISGGIFKTVDPKRIARANRNNWFRGDDLALGEWMKKDNPAEFKRLRKEMAKELKKGQS